MCFEGLIQNKYFGLLHLSLDRLLRREVDFGPPRAGLGSSLVTLGLVTKADRECGWLAKSLEAQECVSDSSLPGVPRVGSKCLLLFLAKSTK